jgi:uroporphyrinogen decarboxylase
VDFLEDFVEAGVDLFNPVQISARGMDPGFLKNSYGDRLVFWGGDYVFTPVENILALFD